MQLKVKNFLLHTLIISILIRCSISIIIHEGDLTKHPSFQSPHINYKIEKIEIKPGLTIRLLEELVTKVTIKILNGQINSGYVTITIVKGYIAMRVMKYQLNDLANKKFPIKDKINVFTMKKKIPSFMVLGEVTIDVKVYINEVMSYYISQNVFIKKNK